MNAILQGQYHIEAKNYAFSQSISKNCLGANLKLEKPRVIFSHGKTYKN